MTLFDMLNTINTEDIINDIIPAEYRPLCKVSIKEMKAKLTDDKFKKVNYSTVYISTPNNAYFTPPESAALCRIVENSIYFPQYTGEQVYNLQSKTIKEDCKDAVEFTIKRLFPVSTFGCCSRYNECSDAKKCLHPNLFYALGCTYRSHLESGRVFYGSEKNV